MDILLPKLVAALLLPPGGSLLAGFAGLLLRRRRPRTGLCLIWLSLGSLLLMSLPAVTEPFLRDSSLHGPLDPAAVAGAGAIVVLGGGRYRQAPEYGDDTVSDSSLIRARYAAYLHRRFGVPLLVTGGVVQGEGAAEADIISDVLEEEFSVPVRWRERGARNTAENAALSAAMLLADGVDRVVLVTHSRHMSRSVTQFEAAGLDVVPAPTRFDHAVDEGWTISDWLPSASALLDARQALYELLGRIWYAIRY